MRRRPNPIRMRSIIGGAGVESYPAVSFSQIGTCGIVFVREGEALFQSTDEEYLALAGDLVLLQALPGKRIQCGPTRAAGEWSTYWMNFAPRPHWHGWLKWPATGLPGLSRLRPGDDAAGRRVIRRFGSFARFMAQPPTKLADDEGLCRCESILIACRAINPLDAAHASDPRIQPVLDHLEQYYADRTTLARLAKIAHLSPSQFERLFVRQTGLMPFSYLERLRLTRADSLLARTNLAISDIARAVGFENPDYFSTRFRRLTGTTPRQKRQYHAGVLKQIKPG